MLTATAAGEGTWGNGLQVDVDYDTSNPASLFNLKVAEMVDQNGSLVPKRVEVFRNLSLYSLDGAYAVAVVNATSELIRLTRGTIATTKATSTSGSISAGDLTALAAASPAKLAFTVNGLGPFEITCPTPASLNQLATDLQTAVDAKVGANVLAVTNTATQLKFETIDATEKASVYVVARLEPGCRQVPASGRRERRHRDQRHGRCPAASVRHDGHVDDDVPGRSDRRPQDRGEARLRARRSSRPTRWRSGAARPPHCRRRRSTGSRS